MTASPRTSRSATARPADRYGDARPPLRRRLGLVAAGLVVALGLAWVLWAGTTAAQREVRWSDVGYDIVDDTTVEVTFTVVKDPSARVTCRLQALDSTFAQVGLATVEVGPAEQRAVTGTAVVRTQQRAVTGVVERCTAD